MTGRLLRLAALHVILCAGLVPMQALAASKIGVTSAAQNQVEGVDGGTSRPLAAGSQVYQDETVRTGAKSMAQLLFLDETSLSIGPQSQVKLDKFVYNPSTGGGDVVLSVTKGAFRFITGSQNPVNYKLKTALATIGVRGTIGDCYFKPEIGLYCEDQEGTLVIVVDGIEYRIGPGQALFVDLTHKVTGPMAPDGSFFAVAGIVPFALYGTLLPGEHEHIDTPDDTTVRTDDLFNHEPPPPPDELPYDPCGGSAMNDAPRFGPPKFGARVVLAASCG